MKILANSVGFTCLIFGLISLGKGHVSDAILLMLLGASNILLANTEIK